MPASAADSAAVNPSGTNTLLANGYRPFFINDKQTFINVPRSLPRNAPDCFIFYSFVFENLSVFMIL